MTTKLEHTPGPWRADWETGLIHCTNGLIAKLRQAPSGAGYPEAEANARLIAAAPELLAALKEMLLLVEDFLPNIGHCVLQNYQRLNEAPIASRAVIAKVEELRK